jgi:hypothetical protein
MSCSKVIQLIHSRSESELFCSEIERYSAYGFKSRVPSPSPPDPQGARADVLYESAFKESQPVATGWDFYCSALSFIPIFRSRHARRRLARNSEIGFLPFPVHRLAEAAN